MYRFFFNVPACQVFTEIDGHSYAYVPVTFCAKSFTFMPCAPRMLRVSHDGTKGGKGEVRVPLGRMGDKIAPLHGLPKGVVFEYHPDPVVVR